MASGQDVIESIGMGPAQIAWGLLGGGIWLADGAELLLVSAGTRGAGEGPTWYQWTAYRCILEYRVSYIYIYIYIIYIYISLQIEDFTKMGIFGHRTNWT